MPEGIGWYRTSFNLALPTNSFSPLAVELDSLPNESNANSRAFIFINGWLVGQYDNQQGPQHQFYVPAGILNDHGANTIAIAEWALSPSGGGLGAVKLVSLGNQAGGVRSRWSTARPTRRGVWDPGGRAANAGRQLVEPAGRAGPVVQGDEHAG